MFINTCRLIRVPIWVGSLVYEYFYFGEGPLSMIGSGLLHSSGNLVSHLVWAFIEGWKFLMYIALILMVLQVTLADVYSKPVELYVFILVPKFKKSYF